MGSFTRNYGDAEPWDVSRTYDGDPPKPGTYDGKLVQLSDHPTDNSPDGVEWIFVITEPPYEGWPGFLYTSAEGKAAGKEMQTMQATGLLTPGKKAVKSTHEKMVALAKPVRMKVVGSTYEGNYKPKLSLVLPRPTGSVSSATVNDEDDIPDDDDEPF